MSFSKNIIDEYYSHIEGIQITYMDDGSPISGYFQNESLEIGIEGINLHFGERLSEFFSQPHVKKDDKKLPISTLISDHEEVKDTIKMIQTFSHESFHLIQALSLRTTNEFVFNLREMRDLELMVFAYIIDAGNHWYYGKHKHILDILEELEDNKFSIWAKDKFKKFSYKNYDVIKNYTQKTNGLTILDIVESSAVVFQELGSRSIGRNIFHFKENTIYTRAFDFFKKRVSANLPEQELYYIFLLISSLSLKYGFCSYFNENEPDNPINIFIHLTKNIEEILVKDSFTLDVEITNIRNLDQLSNLSKEYIAGFNKNSEHNLIYLVNRCIDITNNVIDAIEKYYSVFGAADLMKVDLLYDRKMKPLDNYLKDELPLYDSHYLIAFLINDLNYFTELSAKIGNSDYDTITVDTVHGQQVEFWLESGFSSTMKDFNDLLSKGGCFCCKKHGFTSNKRTILECNEENSLLDRMNIFGDNISLKYLLGFQ